MDHTHHIPKELEQMLLDLYMTPSHKRYATDHWVNKNNQTIAELVSTGYKNFRHTIATEYCAWFDDPAAPVVAQRTQEKLDFFARHLSLEQVASAKKLSQKYPVSPHTFKQFNLITLLLHQYVKNQGLSRELARLSESAQGAPPAINIEGKLISQGLLYSLLEYDTIRQYADINSIHSIMSIGPGYGRTTSIFLRLRPIRKCIFVDLPPALYICQRYLTTLFPEKRAFKYRQFTSFREVEPEFSSAELVFLMPWQIEALPPRSIDLIMAVDSFDDMNMSTIKKYLKYIGIMGKKYFYMKCWKARESEGKILKWGEYPIPTSWQVLVDRECRVQTSFFESLYQLPWLPSRPSPIT